MKLLKYIANLGYGTRRDVQRMFRQERITRADGSIVRADDELNRNGLHHDDIRVDGIALDPPPGSVIMMNKPVGYTCSTNDVNAVVYELLPSRFALRTPLMAPVGRLDNDTSGLLLFTDDGQLNHRITSPRTHLPKTYVATLESPVSDDALALLRGGTLVLKGEESPVAEADVEAVDSTHVRVTITEGRYHQVRRMFAAVGNHVAALHRESVGPLQLGDLRGGEWRVVRHQELQQLTAAIAANVTSHKKEKPVR